MDPQTLINLLFAAVGVLGGWILNNLKGSIDRLRDDDVALAKKVQGIEVLVAGDYVKKGELDQFYIRILSHLDRIEEKLDRKEDK